jgi:hypothetical protein
MALLFNACSKHDPVSELEKTESAMKTAGDAPTPNPSPESASAGPAPATEVHEAIADYKAGKMDDAVTRLQLLRSVTTLTPQQRMALQDSVAAVMQEVYSLAEKGDPRAVAAVAKYEQMQTSR